MSHPANHGWYTKEMQAWMVVNARGEFTAVYGSKDSAEEWADFANENAYPGAPHLVIPLRGSVRLRAPAELSSAPTQPRVSTRKRMRRP